MAPAKKNDNSLINLVINLERSEERLKFMSKQFSDFGLEFEKINAIDATLLNKTKTVLPVRSDNGKKMDIATFACFKSHRKSWQRIVESGCAFGAIFEDDIVLGKDAHVFLKSSNWIPEGVDIIKLETFQRETVVETTATANGAHAYKLHALRSLHLGGGAYILTQSMAQKLLLETERFSMPVDHFLFGAQRFNHLNEAIFQLIPALCMQTFLFKDNVPSLKSTIKSARDTSIKTGMTYYISRQRKSLYKRFLQLSGPFYALMGLRVLKIPFLDKNDHLI